MASTSQLVFPEENAFRALIYTGSNSGDLNSLISDFTITGEAGGNLNFTSDGVAYMVPTDGYVVYSQGVVTDVFLNEDDFLDTYATLPSLVLNHYHEIVLASGPGLPIGDGE